MITHNMKCTVVKNFDFKIPGWQTAIILKINKLQYFNLMMMHNGSLKCIGCPPIKIKQKLNFLTVDAPYRRILHHDAKF